MTVVVTASRGAPGALVTAIVLGATHAAFSSYWAPGGTLLVWSLGTDLVDSFTRREWLLAPIGAVKLIAALAPSCWPERVGPRGPSRGRCAGLGLSSSWAGAASTRP